MGAAEALHTRARIRSVWNELIYAQVAFEPDQTCGQINSFKKFWNVIWKMFTSRQKFEKSSDVSSKDLFAHKLQITILRALKTHYNKHYWTQ